MIDSHNHFWNYNAAEFSWVTDDMAVLRQDFLPPQLEETVVGTGVKGVITVQAKRSTEETRWLLQLAARNQLIKGIVGWVPLKDPSVGDILDELARDSYFRGVREIIQGAPDKQFFDCPDFCRGLREVTRRQIPYDLLIFHHQLASATRWVDKHPDQRFILNHIAKPEICPVFADRWAENIRELAKRQNVFCKFSGVLTEVSGQKWNLEIIRPYFETVFEAFGSERLMFGSDWPVCLLGETYSRWVSAVRTLAEPLSLSEREAFFSKTACRAYSLQA